MTILDQIQREEVRWRILKVLDAGRPQPVAETLVLRTLDDIKLPVTPSSLRRELDYLEERGLIRITGREGPTWLAELTRQGVDVVEYTVPLEPGIARPKKYWD